MKLSTLTSTFQIEKGLLMQNTKSLRLYATVWTLDDWFYVLVCMRASYEFEDITETLDADHNLVIYKDWGKIPC